MALHSRFDLTLMSVIRRPSGKGLMAIMGEAFTLEISVAKTQLQKDKSKLTFCFSTFSVYPSLCLAQGEEE